MNNGEKKVDGLRMAEDGGRPRSGPRASRFIEKLPKSPGFLIFLIVRQTLVEFPVPPRRRSEQIGDIKKFQLSRAIRFDKGIQIRLRDDGAHARARACNLKKRNARVRDESRVR